MTYNVGDKVRCSLGLYFVISGKHYDPLADKYKYTLTLSGEFMEIELDHWFTKESS